MCKLMMAALRAAALLGAAVFVDALQLEPAQPSAPITLAKHVKDAKHHLHKHRKESKHHAQRARDESKDDSDGPGDDTDAVHGEPTEAGCYMRMPKGCKAHPATMRSSGLWHHDVIAEEDNVDVDKCKKRVGFWNVWCDIQDAETQWVSEEQAKQAKEQAKQVEQAKQAAQAQQQASDHQAAAKVATAAAAAPTHDAAQQPNQAPQLQDVPQTNRLGPPRGQEQAEHKQPQRQEETKPAEQKEKPSEQKEKHSEQKEMEKPSEQNETEKKEAEKTETEKKATEKKKEEDERSPSEEGPTLDADDSELPELGEKGEEAFGDSLKPSPAAAESSVVDARVADRRLEDREAVKGEPSEAGCYMRMKSGCPPQRYSRSDLWHHDITAEVNEVDEASCKDRAMFWNTYCGITDAETLHIEKALPSPKDEAHAMAQAVAQAVAQAATDHPAAQQAPQPQQAQQQAPEPGFKMMPDYEKLDKQYQEAASGVTVAPAKPIPKRVQSEQVSTTGSRGRPAADYEAVAADISAAPAVRPTQWQGEQPPVKSPETELGRKEADSKSHRDIVLVFDEVPRHPGCYVRTPTGCDSRPRPADNTHWLRDTGAEISGLDEKRCLHRKSHWDAHCQRNDVDVRFRANTVPEGQIDEEDRLAAEQAGSLSESHIVSGDLVEPGCYIQLVDRCPKVPMKALQVTVWRRDMYAEEHRLSQDECEKRKGFWDGYCGKAGLVNVKFVSGEIEGYPWQHGCYVRVPNGCLIKSKAHLNLWRKDAAVEKQSPHNETACKNRKTWWDDKCGTEGSQMLYIA